ncbi:hypothetical protein [Neorhizobium sp. NCHU2750]|uniref:hypothetical protein n=1 Tax=Neorhizobium sp. NCHU2750 TaxID=1825976 RepID=UPI000EB6B77F|nr:hypothetical protein NCHU2750_01170 [Neorhizobium sp. NCHU2750]
MTTTQVMREPLEELEFAIHRVCAHAILLIDLLFASRLYRVVGDFTQPLLLGGAAAIILFYCGYAVLRGRIMLPILAICFIALIMNQIALFAGRLHIPVQPNVFFQFMWLLSFLPFCFMAVTLGTNYLMKWVITYSTAYCIIYAAMSVLQMGGAMPGSLLAAITSSDAERGARIFLYLAVACLAYFYWLTQLFERITYWRLLFFLSSAAASVLSLSRVYLLIIFLITVLFLFSQRPALITGAARLGMIAGSAYVMSGLLYHSFNPFEQFANDSSGSYRAMEYEVVRQRIFMDPLWGFGVTPSVDMTKSFLGEMQIFSSDLGPMGVWFDLGLLGLALYFFVLWKCAEPLRALAPNYGWPLLMTGAMLTAYGCISPLAMSAPGGTTVTGLIIGLSLGTRKSPFRQGRRPRAALS